jgi:hypothetical protein
MVQLFAWEVFDGPDEGVLEKMGFGMFRVT